MGNRNLVAASLLMVAIAAMLGCAESPTQGGTHFKAIATVPPEYMEATKEALNFGVDLKIYDDAGWIATDKVQEMGLANRGFTNAGYVVEPLGDLYRVTFLFKVGDELKVAATVDVKPGGMESMGSVVDAKIMDSPDAPAASDAEILLYNVLHSAGSAPGLRLCTDHPYNHVVIPDDRVGKHEYRVYFLLATDKPKTVPQSGHVLVRVADDGKTILEVKPFSTSCAVVDVSDPRIAELGFSNLALDSPSEVQVFTFLRYNVPLFMVTKNGLYWNIDSNGISFVKKK